MKILALEGSTNQRSVALVDGGRLIAEASTLQHRPDPILILADQCLSTAGWRPGDVERLAIGIGPGSYTGIRGTIALAMGWNLAHGTAIVAVSSFKTLAESLRRQGIRGEITVCSDAQRGDFCFAKWYLDSSGVTALGELALRPLSSINEFCREHPQIFAADFKDPTGNVTPAYPSAASLAALASAETPIQDISSLSPVHLRETVFVRAAPPRFPV